MKNPHLPSLDVLPARRKAWGSTVTPTDQMVSHYGKTANRKLLAIQAMAKLNAAERPKAKTAKSDQKEGEVQNRSGESVKP
jgi:hypothetical protein